MGERERERRSTTLPPGGWPEALCYPALFVDPGRSHAREIEALRIEHQAEPHGPGRSSRTGHAREPCQRRGAEATHAPSAAASGPYEEEVSSEPERGRSQTLDRSLVGRPSARVGRVKLVRDGHS